MEARTGVGVSLDLSPPYIWRHGLPIDHRAIGVVVLASQLAPRTLSLFSLGTRIIERLSLCEQVQGIFTKACMLEWQALFPLARFSRPRTETEPKQTFYSS